MITTVILDFDGTLASSLEGIHKCLQETLSRYGYPEPTLAEVQQTVGLTLEETIRRLTDGRCEGPQLEEAVASYRALFQEKGSSLATLFPGAAEALSELRQMGIRIVVVSNKGRQALQRLVEKFGIAPLIDVMVGAEAAIFRKPDARLYTQSLAPRLPGVRGSQILMVGDSDTDILFARNAGLRTCYASYGYGCPQACMALRPKFILDDISQLPSLIRSINSPE